MRKVFKKLLLFVFVFITIINTFILFDVKASESSTYVLDNPSGTTQYEINFVQDTYYSGKSEDDAWYQALNENSGQMSEDEIIDEFSLFSGRHLEYENLENTTSDDNSGLTIKGSLYIECKDQSTSIMSLKNIRVDLCKKNLIGYTYIDTTYTDMEGNYVFNYEDIDHEVDFNENSSYNLFIRTYPDSYSFEIARDWIFTFISYYYCDSNIFTVDENDEEISLGRQIYLYTEGDMAYCAYIMSQALVVAQTFAKDMGMEVRYSYGNKMTIAFNDVEDLVPFCFYTFSAIPQNCYLNYDAIMHEYGHFVQGKLGTYGSDLLEIIINNPNHYIEDDHFYDKPQKQYAMELTWSEAWATVFSQIAQEHYINEYENYDIENLSEFEINKKDSNIKISNKISCFGDKHYDGYPLEGGKYWSKKRNSEINVINENSCEAQESAVIQFLWDLYDGNPIVNETTEEDNDGDLSNAVITEESYDSIDWTEEQWWLYTTYNNITTLQEFIYQITRYRYEYILNLNEIDENNYYTENGVHIEKIPGVGELLEVHQIAPGDLTINNLDSVFMEVAPQFSWKVNGSTDNPNNQFQLVFTLENGMVIYETDYISVSDIYNQIEGLNSSDVYLQTFTYTLSQSDWSEIIECYSKDVNFYVYVRGFNTNSFTSGPYYSVPIHLTFEIPGGHNCEYTVYTQYNATHHKATCNVCDDYHIQPHAVSSSGSNRYKPCVACGYRVDTQSTPTFEGMLSNQNRMITENGSYILDNGIIVLVDEDIEKYLNGTLVFYEENSKSNIS